MKVRRGMDYWGYGQHGTDQLCQGLLVHMRCIDP